MEQTPEFVTTTAVSSASTAARFTSQQRDVVNERDVFLGSYDGLREEAPSCSTMRYLGDVKLREERASPGRLRS